jgi:hypothetical protein
MLLLSSVSFASTANCSTQATLASYGTGTGSGCYEYDQTFGNFAVTDGSSGIGSTAQSTSTVDIVGSINNFSAVTSPWAVTSTFSGATVADWEAGGGTTEGTITYLTNTTEAYFTSGTYPTPSPGDYIAITSMSLTVSGLTVGGVPAPGSIAVTETFCIGAGPCTVGGSGNAITLSATFDDTNTPTYACSVLTDSGATCGTASSGSPITLTFAGPVTTLDFSDNYDLVGDGNMTSLSNLFNTDETSVPEPSMFVLLGGGLGVAILLRAYRKSS